MAQNTSFTVSRYSLSGQLLESYPNARIAAEAMQTNQRYISKAAMGGDKVHTACGYIWRRGTAPEVDVQSLLKQKWLGSSPLSKQQQTIGQYDLDGNLLNTYLNTVEASKAVGFHKNGIRDVIKGRGHTYGGFIWSKVIKKKIHVDPELKIKNTISQYDLDGRWIRSFISCLAASKVVNTHHSNISYALSGTTLTAGGFLWRKGQKLRINTNELRSHPRFPKSILQKHMDDKRKKARSKITAVTLVAEVEQ